MGQSLNHKGTKKCTELNKNENTTYQNLFDTVKAVIRGIFRVLNICIKKEKQFQTNNVNSHLKKLEENTIQNKYEEGNKDKNRKLMKF